MPDEVQTEGTEEAALSTHDIVVAELAKLKEDASYVPALPEGIVLDAEMPDGYYKIRPCLEEFVAAGYKVEQYEGWFRADKYISAWGPPWSNPNWTKDQREILGKLPDVLVVRSQVRRTGTRTARARAPSRHRFKQFLFGDPSYRLVRNGERQVLSSKVLTHLDELVEKEAQGMLSVHFIDGRRVNLELLKGGLVEVERPSLPAPPSNPPLDSAANDDPAGIPMTTFLDGSFPGDPAAAATLEQMLKDKSAEQGEPPGEEGSDPLLAKAIADIATAIDALIAQDESNNAAEGTDPLASTPMDEVTDNEMSREDTQSDILEDISSDESAEVTETEEVSETPVPDTVPDIKAPPAPVPEQNQHHHKSGKKGNKR